MSIDDWQLDYLLRIPKTFEVGGGYWYKVEVRKVQATPYRPHGIKYSLTLHAPDGERVFGIDNAHAITQEVGMKRLRMKKYDHIHLGKRVLFYEYRTASDLVDDFFNEVDRILVERGVTK
jgi:hypothetical protein